MNIDTLSTGQVLSGFVVERIDALPILNEKVINIDI